MSKVRIQDDLHTLADCFTPVYLLNATVSLLMLSDGTPWRPIIHSEDILRASFAALKGACDAVHDEAINVVAASENYQFADIPHRASWRRPTVRRS